MNRDEEEAILPHRQADNTQPEDQTLPGRRVGEHVKSLAEVISDLADTQLNTKVSIDALTQVAFVACTADVIAKEGMTDLPEEEITLLRNRLSPGQARVLRKLITAHQPKR